MHKNKPKGAEGGVTTVNEAFNESLQRRRYCHFGHRLFPLSSSDFLTWVTYVDNDDENENENENENDEDDDDDDDNDDNDDDNDDDDDDDDDYNEHNFLKRILNLFAL